MKSERSKVILFFSFHWMAVIANGLIKPAWQRALISHEIKKKAFQTNYLTMKNNKTPSE